MDQDQGAKPPSSETPSPEESEIDEEPEDAMTADEFVLQAILEQSGSLLLDQSSPAASIRRRSFLKIFSEF